MTDLEEAGFWLEQAAVDLQVAEELQEKFPAAACFHAQQAGEKAVKSICYAGGIGGNATRAYYLNDLYQLLEGLAPLRALLPPLEEVLALDAFCVPTRYPDAWDRATPAKMYTPKQAAQAIHLAGPRLAPVAKFLTVAGGEAKRPAAQDAQTEEEPADE